MARVRVQDRWHRSVRTRDSSIHRFVASNLDKSLPVNGGKAESRAVLMELRANAPHKLRWPPLASPPLFISAVASSERNHELVENISVFRPVYRPPLQAAAKRVFLAVHSDLPEPPEG